MVLKGVIHEDFVNYKVPAMYLAFPMCTFKCDKLNGCQVCQNESLADNARCYVISPDDIYKQFVENPIAEAIVCSGLEPFDSVEDVLDLVDTFRTKYKCMSDIVIYTGYTEEEVLNDERMRKVLNYKNIVVKYGRFLMNQPSHYDEVLGVNLASPNQYAKRYN